MRRKYYLCMHSPRGDHYLTKGGRWVIDPLGAHYFELEKCKKKYEHYISDQCTFEILTEEKMTMIRIMYG